MSRCPPWMRQGHGTEARARRHQREGEKPCPACLEAARLAWHRRKEARNGGHDQAVVPDLPAVHAIVD